MSRSSKLLIWEPEEVPSFVQGLVDNRVRGFSTAPRGNEHLIGGEKMLKAGRAVRGMRAVAVCLPVAISATCADAAKPAGYDGLVLSGSTIGPYIDAHTAEEACAQAGKSAGWPLKSFTGDIADWTTVHCTYSNGIIAYLWPARGAYCAEGEAMAPGTKVCVKIVHRQHPPNSCVRAGNPIYPLQGNKRQEEVLGSWLAGPPLTMAYDSRSKLPSPNGKPTFAGQASPSFGPLWQSNLHKRLQVLNDHDGKLLAVQAARGAGLWSSFYSTDGVNLKADANVNDRVTSSGGGWQYIDAASRAIETYDADGKVLAVAYANGAKLIYTYSTASTPATIAPQADLIIQVQDQNGRAVNFVYETAGSELPPRIKTITNAAGQQVSMDYDGGSRLLQVNWPDSTARRYRYSGDWALSGIDSENGRELSSYTYDDAGRAIDTQWADGAYHYSVSYATPPEWTITDTYDAVAQIYVRDHVMSNPTGLVITLPNNDTSQVDTAVVLGAVQPVRFSQSAGSGCMAASSALTYDASGNVSSVDDFNQNRRCSVFDASNRETSRIEGLANTVSCSSVVPVGATLPVGSRRTSTQYHPDWRLATAIAEPGRVTTYVYNGQPDPFNGGALASCAGGALLPNGKPLAVLCKQVEQATTDADGHLGFGAPMQAGVPMRQSSWTYDAAGRVLTAVDTLNRTTVYAYFTDSTADHTVGDLRSVTNAKSQVTSYQRYDKQGLLVQSTDANGVDTFYSYDARGRVKTASVGGQSYRYDYWPDGQLQRVTAPDASYLDYSYDNARRLTLIVDKLGNQIQYGYDNLGNRVIEKTIDPLNRLTRQITRVFDALGRVQQTTGM